MKHIELVKIAELPSGGKDWITCNGGEKIDISKPLLPAEKREIYNKVKEWKTSLNPTPPIRMKDPYSGVIMDSDRFVLEVFLSSWKENYSFTLYQKIIG